MGQLETPGPAIEAVGDAIADGEPDSMKTQAEVDAEDSDGEKTAGALAAKVGFSKEVQEHWQLVEEKTRAKIEEAEPERDADAKTPALKDVKKEANTEKPAIDLTKLGPIDLDEESADEPEQVDTSTLRDCVLEWAGKEGPSCAAAVIEHLEKHNGMNLLWDREVFRALAPAKEGDRLAPKGFPGTKSQYVQAMRSRATGRQLESPVLSALVSHWTSDSEAASSSSPSASVAAEAICTQMEASEDSIKQHVSDELAPLKGVLTAEPGETTAQAITRKRLEMEFLKRTRAEEIVQEKREREERKKEAERKKAEQPAKKRRT